MRAHATTIPFDSEPDLNPEATLDDIAELLEQARAGDREAFEVLLRRHERQVLSTARQLLMRDDDAQDAAQEVFLRLYRHLHRIDPSRPLGAWIYRVTVNVCHDLRRRQGRHRARPLSDLEESGELEGDEKAPDPGRAALLSEVRSMVRSGLRSLSPREQRALVLRDLQGLSTRETAEVLGTSETTVRSQICRARLKMKRYREGWLKGKQP